MAIKLPDPGNGIPEQKTGNDEWTNMKIVRENFADQSNAASRLVGTENGQIPLSESIHRAMHSNRAIFTDLKEQVADADSFEVGSKTYHYTGVTNAPDFKTSFVTIETRLRGPYGAKYQVAYAGDNQKVEIGFMYRFHTSTWQPWRKIWSSGNTKLDTNGALAPSSPTIDLYSDHIETNTDAERMGAEFVRNGVGDYTIKNTTGLRVNDGWYIKIPNDMNGNPKVAVAVDTDKNGNLSIKTYKRIFSMETFTFGPDLNEPLDIPEGRWIDLRFNDLPQEQLDEPAI